jgi:hypothetical protein
MKRIGEARVGPVRGGNLKMKTLGVEGIVSPRRKLGSVVRICRGVFVALEEPGVTRMVFP